MSSYTKNSEYLQGFYYEEDKFKFFLNKTNIEKLVRKEEKKDKIELSYYRLDSTETEQKRMFKIQEITELIDNYGNQYKVYPYNKGYYTLSSISYMKHYNLNIDSEDIKSMENFNKNKSDTDKINKNKSDTDKINKNKSDTDKINKNLQQKCSKDIISNNTSYNLEQYNELYNKFENILKLYNNVISFKMEPKSIDNPISSKDIKNQINLYSKQLVLLKGHCDNINKIIQINL
jgi:hypothetical protein